LSNSLLAQLSTTYSSSKFKDIITKDANKFGDLIKIALENHAPASWRAAYICNHQTIANDPLLLPYLAQIIAEIPTKKDGHQRELLRLALKMDVNENLEGKLFDTSVTIWESVEKSPSARMIAFKVIVKIASKYPEMKSEVAFLTQDHYLDSLSPGIRRSMLREANKLSK
tara:strand:- start:32120 stop:32629 length:510 start_codon:yes stop_codon:yes gene_type:complete